MSRTFVLVLIGILCTNSASAEDSLYVMLFEGVPQQGTKQAHVVTTRIELSKEFRVFVGNGHPQLDGTITRQRGKLRATKVRVTLANGFSKFSGAIKMDTPFSPQGGLASGGFQSFYFIVTSKPKKHLKKRGSVSAPAQLSEFHQVANDRVRPNGFFSFQAKRATSR